MLMALGDQKQHSVFQVQTQKVRHIQAGVNIKQARSQETIATDTCEDAKLAFRGAGAVSCCVVAT